MDGGFVLEGVSLRRGGTRVLAGVSARLPAGRCTAVVGDSGAGKSSLLRLLNRLADPSAGRVLLDGIPLPELDVRWLRRQVSLVAQQPVLLTSSVAAELQAGRSDLDDAQVAGLLERVGLGAGFAARGTGGLSGGQAQRVCIARALAVRPRALLLDEPAAALDERSARVIDELICAFVAGGGTVVLAGHRLAGIGRIAAHALVLRAGRLVESGDPAALGYLASPGRQRTPGGREGGAS